MPVRQRARRVAPPLLAAAAAALAARAIWERDATLRLVTTAFGRRRSGRPRPPEESRLYARGGRRLEAHLGRRSDGRLTVLSVAVDGSGRSAAYAVDEVQPWRDFERQAGLRHAAWGPCRDVSAGL
jgi:hypothetical protein